MIKFTALDPAVVATLRAGGVDANGHVPERAVSTGSATPCRYCLQPIEKGHEYLILSFRPFPKAQPYAEQGPIFIHAGHCERSQPDDEIPLMLRGPSYIIRGYSSEHRIIYGTGQIVRTPQIREMAGALLQTSEVSYLHVRSATNNCYQCRIDRLET